jgi:hypothetical protein
MENKKHEYILVKDWSKKSGNKKKLKEKEGEILFNMSIKDSIDNYSKIYKYERNIDII